MSDHLFKQLQLLHLMENMGRVRNAYTYTYIINVISMLHRRLVYRVTYIPDRVKTKS